jgi:hypothetical protein
VGFDNEVNIYEVAEVLKKYFGETLIGHGVLENGLPQGCLYITNPKRKKRYVERPKLDS